MSNVLVLLKNNINIAVLKQPKKFLLGIIVPIIILLFSTQILGGNNGRLNIGVIDKDNSTTSKVIIDTLKKDNTVKVVNLKESEEKDALINQTVETIVKIPDGYEDRVINNKDVKINTSTSEEGNTSLAKNILGTEIQNINDIAKVCEKNKELYKKTLESYAKSDSGSVKKQKLSDLSTQYTLGQIFIGFLILFMLNRGINNSEHYFKEKTENVFTRIFICPVKTWEYYVADGISSYLTILLQIILSLIGIKAINYDLGVPILSIFIVLNVLAVVAVALSMMIRSFSKNANQAGNTYMFVLIIMVMIGGCFVPYEFMPVTFQKLSYFTPVRWAMKSIIEMQSGIPLSSIVQYLGIMLLFAIAFFVVAAYKTSKQDKEFSI